LGLKHTLHDGFQNDYYILETCHFSLPSGILNPWLFTARHNFPSLSPLVSEPSPEAGVSLCFTHEEVGPRVGLGTCPTSHTEECKSHDFSALWRVLILCVFLENQWNQSEPTRSCLLHFSGALTLTHYLWPLRESLPNNSHYSCKERGSSKRVLNTVDPEEVNTVSFKPFAEANCLVWLRVKYLRIRSFGIQ
jgi:hypothetical protein